MSRGPEHYAAAVQLIAQSRTIGGDDLEPAQLLIATLLEAQVHATLAHAAATALSENGSMPGADYDEWAKAASAAPFPVTPLTVWWLDDGEENPGKPPLYTSEAAARDAALKRYEHDNPFTDTFPAIVSWREPEDEDDATEDAELSVKGRRTGIFVRPVQPTGSISGCAEEG